MTDELKDSLFTLAKKELLLAELTGWLKAKGYWREALEDLGWKIEP